MERLFQYRSDIQEVQFIRQDLTGVVKEWGIPESEMRQIIVIIEELFSNIVRFAFNDNHEHIVEIILRKNDRIITMTISDDGVSFNPLDYNPVPLSDPAASDAGGMGITLIRAFADSIEYRRLLNRNHLEITKSIKSNLNTSDT